MNLNTSQKLRLSAISLTLLVSSCASTPIGAGVKSDGEDQYWYCAPGDKKSWRCAEDKEALGLSYYRFWKTIPDPEAEGTDELQPEPQEQVDTPVLVQGAKLNLLDQGDVKDPELEIESEPEPESVKPTVQKDQSFEKLYSKVLQLAAYNSQAQAQSFADTLSQDLTEQPSVIRTRVRGKLFYTVVFDQLKSEQEAEQLKVELAQSFPDINPWLRSRSGFDAMKVD